MTASLQSSAATVREDSPAGRILFLTSGSAPWGGSEELWAGAALQLRTHGVEVQSGRISDSEPVKNHAIWSRLKAAGVGVENFRIPELARKLPVLAWRHLRQFSGPFFSARHRWLCFLLKRRAVDLVVISQEGSFDGIENIELPLICLSLGIPYVLVCQAKPAKHPLAKETLRRMAVFFREAAATYFLSEENRRAVSAQLGGEIPRSEVVGRPLNPFFMSRHSKQDWPRGIEGIFHLACMGRMGRGDTGWGILFEVLALEKWRKRPVVVNLFGMGPFLSRLQKQAQSMDLRSVKFCGAVHDIEGIWKTHHALLQPFGNESLPLVKIDAMRCGRVAIVAGTSGGYVELIRSGVNGFVASSSTMDLFDAAMEEAWQQRARWPEIGAQAAADMHALMSSNAAIVLSDKLRALLADAKANPRKPSNPFC